MGLKQNESFIELFLSTLLKWDIQNVDTTAKFIIGDTHIHSIQQNNGNGNKLHDQVDKVKGWPRQIYLAGLIMGKNVAYDIWTMTQSQIK